MIWDSNKGMTRRQPSLALGKTWVMEMGMLIAAFGRPRVAILKKGHVEVSVGRKRHHLSALQQPCERGCPKALSTS